MLSDSVRCVLKWCMQEEESNVLGSKEQRRAQVLNRVLAGTWTRAQAAATLDLERAG